MFWLRYSLAPLANLTWTQREKSRGYVAIPVFGQYRNCRRKGLSLSTRNSFLHSANPQRHPGKSSSQQPGGTVPIGHSHCSASGFFSLPLEPILRHSTARLFAGGSGFLISAFVNTACWVQDRAGAPHRARP